MTQMATCTNQLVQNLEKEEHTETTLAIIWGDPIQCHRLSNPQSNNS